MGSVTFGYLSIGVDSGLQEFVVAITGVYDDAPNAGIAEILIQIEETSDN